MSAPDWKAILTAQGIDPAFVDQAEENVAMAVEAAASVAHDPTVGAAPMDIVTLLLQRRDDQ